MRNARLDEAQAGIKISGRNINNLRCTDDTILMAERNQELKNLLKVKEEGEKVMNEYIHQYFPKCVLWSCFEPSWDAYFKTQLH